MTKNSIAITPVIAVYGSITGELASAVFSLLSLKIHKCQISHIASQFDTFSYMKRIFRMSFPITLNRALVTVLMNIEAILIPLCLRKNGSGSSDALKIYGSLTGMALPLVLFPSSIITSIATMLLPVISEAQNEKNSNAISKSAEKILEFCLISGIFCTFVFVFYGNAAGYLIFNDLSVGSYITILGWLCPFLYISITFASILNGLGKTKTTFYHNSIITILKIIFIVIFVPSIGIKGYLWGLLAGQIIICILHYHVLATEYTIDIHPFRNIVIPIVCSTMSILIAVPFYKSFSSIWGSVSYQSLLLSGIITSVSYIILIKLAIFPDQQLFPGHHHQ